MCDCACGVLEGGNKAKCIREEQRSQWLRIKMEGRLADSYRPPDGAAMDFCHEGNQKYRIKHVK